jgi:hypothetical protein
MAITDTIKQRLQRFASASSQQLKKAMTRQISKPNSDYTWMTGIFDTKYNPDEKRYTDYQDMMKDPQIKGALSLINNALLQKRPIITPADDSPESIEIAEFVERNLDNMAIPFRKVRRDLYTAIPYGYAVSEIVYKFDETSSQIVFDRIVSIDIETIEDCFKLDEYGNVTEVIQDLDVDGENKIPVEKCLIFSFDSEFNNPYGESALKSLYDTWYAKRKVLKWWVLNIQKHEAPTVYGKVGPSGDAGKLLEQIEAIREGRQQFTIGSEDDVGIIESTHRGEGFQQFIAHADMMIHRRLGIGTLLLGQQEASGSYAQSQTHDSTFKLFMDGIHEDLASVFQQKIQELVSYNYNTDVFPDFSFEPLTEKDIIGLLNALKPYVDSYAISPQDAKLQELIDIAVEQYGGVKIQADEEDDTPMIQQQPQTVDEVISETEDAESVEPPVSMIERVKNVLPSVNK